MTELLSSTGIEDLFRSLGRRTLWVVGDIMLDEYLIGSVDRISPEGPVPILRVENRELRPGGAANVAHQIAALGGHAILAGAVGTDAQGEEILRLCDQCRIDSRSVIRARARPTTWKTRTLSKGQQLLRIDSEDTSHLDEDTTRQLLECLKSNSRPDAIVVSDYAKGVVTPQLIESLRAAAPTCPILVDPKHPDFGVYRGAQILTPNLVELRNATNARFDPQNLEEIASAARELARINSFEALVITLGERGLLLVPSAGKHTHVAAVRRTVFDVTGAGDTVIGVLASAVAAGASLSAGAKLANAAAGIAVGEVGTVAITAKQICQALSNSSGLKVLDRVVLAERVASWRAAGKQIVFTNGCFDLLHAGHLALIRTAAQYGDVLVLAINDDDSIRRLKGPTRPLVSAADRAAVLAALECVDAVTVFPEDTPLETLSIVRPQVLVKGADYLLDDVVGRDLVERAGGRVVLVPLEGSWSTTRLMERIRGTVDEGVRPPISAGA